MARTTQNTTDSVTTADAHQQGVDGGLNLKADPTRMTPPETTRADNCWYQQPGNVNQLPAFASTMQPNTSHVYNLHARDLNAPSSNGDVMVHGEVLDAPGSATNRFTSPIWTDANGTSLNTAQPMPPFQLRTRVLSSQNNYTSSSCDRANPMFMREQAPTIGTQRRYAIAYSTGTQINMTFGLCDGMTETPGNANYFISADYSDGAGIQNSNQWVVAYLSNSTLSMMVGDFAGNQPAFTTITTSALSTQAYFANGGFQQYNPMHVLQHNGRTYIAYISGGQAPYVTNLYDVLNRQTFVLGSNAAVPSGPFNVASANPYPTTPVTGTTFLSVTLNGFVNVVARTSDTAAGINVAGPIALPANSYPAVGVQTSGANAFMNALSTSTVTVFDSLNGVGPGAKFGIVLFRHQAEQPTGGVAAYQAVTVEALSFAANATVATNAGTLTLVSSNTFRTPAGAALACKAFTSQPGEAWGAGLPGAKNAYVLVRSGAYEPAPNYQGNGGSTTQPFTYSQPTYFILDHQARVVGRTLEQLAPGGLYSNIAATPIAGSGTPYYARFPLAYSLGNPLFSTGAANDLSILDITLPAWALTLQTGGAAYAFGGMEYLAQVPTSVLYQLTGVCLSLSAAVSGVPPVQAGAYSIFSGMLTSMHDGRGISEANFHFAAMNPVAIVTNTTTTSPGYGPPGTYRFTYIWEYVDAQGHVHRSQPALPVTTVVPAGSFYANSTLTLPLPVSSKMGVGGTLRIRLYRTVVNTTDRIYYLVATRVISALGPNAYTVDVADGNYYDPVALGTGVQGGLALTAQPRLYNSLNATTSNYTYLSSPPPPFLWQVTAKGRAFGLAQVLGQFRLYYSSVANGQFPFEWNAFNYAPVPPELGDVRSLEVIDDKIVVLGTRSNAVMNGDGPDASGPTPDPVINAGFSPIQPVPTPAGIIGTGSPVRVPTGVMFQGYGGIQSVGRDTAITSSGAQVDQLTGRQVNNPGQIYGRAVTLPTLQSVVWANAMGPALVYNYVTQKWSTWPLLSNVACMAQRMDGSIVVAMQPVSGSQYATLASPTSAGADFGVLGQAYAPLCLTQNSAPGLVVETPWILPSGESAGEGQIWEVAVTGSYLGPHILQVEQSYNYGTSYTSLKQFRVDVAPQRYQYRVRPSTGTRLWAIRYRLTLLPLSALSAGYSMAALGDLVVFSGVQQGTTRLGASTSG